MKRQIILSQIQVKQTGTRTEWWWEEGSYIYFYRPPLMINLIWTFTTQN
uniref:Uncharacterized protein n=1 Tax=Rhizophora mucronata TaxID=61149 RepID=A0A2P2NTF4_RHIMU